MFVLRRFCYFRHFALFSSALPDRCLTPARSPRISAGLGASGQNPQPRGCPRGGVVSGGSCRGMGDARGKSLPLASPSFPPPPPPPFWDHQVTFKHGSTVSNPCPHPPLPPLCGFPQKVTARMRGGGPRGRCPRGPILQSPRGASESLPSLLASKSQYQPVAHRG